MGSPAGRELDRQVEVDIVAYREQECFRETIAGTQQHLTAPQEYSTFLAFSRILALDHEGFSFDCVTAH